MKNKKIILIFITILALFGFNILDDNLDFEIVKNVEIYVNIIKNLKTNYYRQIEFRDLFTKNFKSLTSQLDPYTIYYPDSEIEKYQLDNYNTKYSTGIEIDSIDGNYYIVNIVDSSEAFLKDLNIGDIIEKIDNKSIEGKNFYEVKQMLLKQPGEKLLLTLNRNGKKIDKELFTKNYNTTAVPVAIVLNNNIGYIKLTEFTEKCASEFLNNFQKLKKQGITSLIIDLRDNPGGLLDQAVQIVNIFIAKDMTVVVSRGKDDNSIEIFRTRNKPIDENIPIVVLINENSASASEIVAGTFQDYDRAVIVGRNSFGKGLVQRFVDVGYNSKLKITISQYYLPSGRCIQEIDYASKQTSQPKIFYTQNKREVIDQHGIHPDKVAADDCKQFFNFIKSKHFFLLCNVEYYRYIDLNKPIDIFAIDNAKVKSYVNKYIVQSISEIAKLKDISQKYQDLKPNCDIIQNTIIDKETNLIISKQQLMTSYIKMQIVRRQKGNIQMYKYSINEDNDIREALNILNNQITYNKILGKK